MKTSRSTFSHLCQILDDDVFHEKTERTSSAATSLSKGNVHRIKGSSYSLSYVHAVSTRLNHSLSNNRRYSNSKVCCHKSNIFQRNYNKKYRQQNGDLTEFLNDRRGRNCVSIKINYKSAFMIILQIQYYLRARM